MAAAGVGSLASILLVLSITHFLPKALAGTFFASTAAFLIVEAICSLGVTTGLVRKLPECVSRGRAEECPLTIAIALRPVSVVAITVATAGVALAPALGAMFASPDAAEQATRMLRTLAIFIPMAACNDAVLAATQGLRTMRPTVFVENLGRLCAQPAAVAVVGICGGGPTTLALAWAAPYLIALIINVAWLKVLLRRLGVRSTLLRAGVSHRVDYAALRARFWAYTGPRALATVVQTALKRSDVILVAALTTATQAAIYATASRFVTFGLVGVFALQQALTPLVSKLLSSGRRADAESAFQTATVWMMCIAWPIYLLSANFAEQLLRIFGEGYDAGRHVVVILSLAMLFATACGPVDSVLLMAGRSWLSLANTTVALITDVGLNAILIPRAGITGAAISWAAAIVVRNALPLVQLRHYERLHPESGVAIRLGITCLAIFGLLPLIVKELGASTFPVVYASGAGALLYAYLLFGPPKLLGEMSVISALRGATRMRRPEPTPRPASVSDGRIASVGEDESWRTLPVKSATDSE